MRRGRWGLSSHTFNRTLSLLSLVVTLPPLFLNHSLLNCPRSELCSAEQHSWTLSTMVCGLCLANLPIRSGPSRAEDVHHHTSAGGWMVFTSDGKWELTIRHFLFWKHDAVVLTFFLSSLLFRQLSIFLFIFSSLSSKDYEIALPVELEGILSSV